MISYNRKSEMRKSRNGIDCYVFKAIPHRKVGAILPEVI